MAVAEMNERAISARETRGRESTHAGFDTHVQIARRPAAAGERFDEIARFDVEKHGDMDTSKKRARHPGGPLYLHALDTPAHRSGSVYLRPLFCSCRYFMSG